MDNQGSVQVLVWLVILAAALAQKQDDVFKGQTKDTPFHRCLVNDFERVPCGDPDIDSASCEDLNCCFDQAQCFYAREVTVQCLRDGQFRVVVSRDATIPHLRLESVSLLESNNVAPCGPVHASATFVVFQFPVSTCGTTMMEEEGYVVYENKLSSSYELGIGPLGTITRDSVYELSFLCRYIGSEVVSLVAEVNTVPPPLPVAAPGPLHVELRLANGQCDSKGCSDATAYSSYYAESDYPVTKVLRDPLYVEVRILGRTDPNIVLTLEHCWATSSSIPLSMPQWSLLVDGCPYHADPYLTSLVPVDGSSGLPNPTHYKRFIVKMFTFIDPVSKVPQKETVFIHCSTAVCYPSAGNACEHACGRKRRRAVKIAQSREETAIASSDAVIFEPPFTSLARSLSDGDHEGRHAAKITQSREETAIASSDAVIFEPRFTSLARSLSDGDHEVPQSLAYGLLGVAAAVVLAVFALVLAVVWRSRHHHVAATKL
ncbi:hypothetical protein SKAU_G00200670 [Synaphobranchus kaupii]|uniref:Zona pellucida sperm-binding protein 4 n=1 Tax=Synaphobranchus kaupii TaxID=118154 RepID=A0A9Q1FFF8_SYNKA|nr:hypothetical protein SKAU_G00200670 [Synaphobranchus kaupii]